MAFAPCFSDNPGMTPRFFCPFPLSAGATVQLPAETAHHAVNVLKVGAGDTAILFDGRGGQWRATLAMNGKPPKAALMATLETFDAQDNESPLDITLVQALPAGDKMDWVVQKAVELGVARIQPVMARRSVVKLSGERAERRVAHWRGVVLAACEQSGRTRVPPVAEPCGLDEYLAGPGALGATGTGLLLDPFASQTLTGLARVSQPVSVLIGPEGGLSAAERQLAQAAGYQPARMGPRVLRTETAAVVALALLQGLAGDIGA